MRFMSKDLLRNLVKIITSKWISEGGFSKVDFVEFYEIR